MIYLDNAATTPIRVSLIMKLPTLFNEYYGNPSSLYTLGTKSKEMIDRARGEIAEQIHCSPDEIYFTSGGTESDNWALRGTVNPGDHIITTEFEHPAILNTCKYLETQGVEVTYIKPNPKGFVELGDFIKARQPNTKLISVMLVNNEIGTIQRVKEIAQWATSEGILVHTDAVQALGHIPVDVEDLCVDMLSASGHKFGAPKGVGFLYVKKTVNLSPMIFGGHQENNMRAGTENPVGIFLLAEALKMSCKDMKYSQAGVSALLDHLFIGLDSIKGVHLNGSPDNKVRGIINVCIDGVKAENLIMFLNEEGICISAGSACMSGTGVASHVLKSIGLTDEQASSSVRISIGQQTTVKDIDTFLEKFKHYIKLIREQR